MMMQGLIAVVGADAQSGFGFVMRAVITGFTAVRPTLRTPEANVVACSTFLNPNCQLGSTLMTGSTDISYGLITAVINGAAESGA